MSISIKTDSWKVKDENGQYRGTAIFSSTLPTEAQQIVQQSEQAITAKGAETLASIPSDYTDLSNEVDDLKSEIDEIITPDIVSTTETLTKNTTGMALEDGYAISYDGSITALSAYYTYIYKVEHTGEMYFDDTPTNSAVLMFAVYTGYPSASTWKGTRYRMSDNNLPSSANKLAVNKDEYIAVSAYLSVPASQLYFTLYEDYETDNGLIFGDVNLNNNQIEQGNKKQNIYIKYVSGAGADDSTERVEVYQPTKTGFIRYDVLHSVNAVKNSDIWRLGYASLVDDNFENGIPLTVTAEWECAIHLNNAGDYSGGVIHGNETLNSVAFFVDGVYSDITAYTTITQVHEINILTSSNLYDSTDSDRLIAVRGCNRRFCSEGLVIKQSLQWAVNDNTTWCYMAMNAPSKTYVEKFYMDTDMNEKNISFGLFDNVKMVTLFKNGGITNQFSIEEYPSGLSGGDKLLTADNGGNPYVKCYYVVTNGMPVTTSTLWKSTAKYRFDS